jgi:ABC-type sugar transport system substrate-binding protein
MPDTSASVLPPLSQNPASAAAASYPNPSTSADTAPILIAAGAEAVGISCNEPTGCKDVIDTAMEAGIPVMTWDSDSPESSRFTYLGVDNCRAAWRRLSCSCKPCPMVDKWHC